MLQEKQTTLWNFDQPLSYLDVLKAVEQGGNWVTRRTVALQLGRSKSPSLVKMLTELVAEGFLFYELRPLPNSVDMYVYSVTEKGANWILQSSSEAS